MIKPYRPTEEAISLKQPSGYVINVADELKAHREQRRYEIARTMLPTVYDVLGGYIATTPDDDMMADCADIAVKFADVLLTRLARIDNNISPDDMATEMLE